MENWAKEGVKLVTISDFPCWAEVECISSHFRFFKLGVQGLRAFPIVGGVWRSVWRRVVSIKCDELETKEEGKRACCLAKFLFYYVFVYFCATWVKAPSRGAAKSVISFIILPWDGTLLLTARGALSVVHALPFCFPFWILLHICYLN